MKERRYTFHYALIQSSYWMTFCVAISFATIYLQGIGLSNTQLGILSALSNLSGMFIGPWLAGKMDSDERWSAMRLAPYLLGIQALSCLILLVKGEERVIGAVVFAVFMAFCSSFNTLVLKVYADLNHQGAHLNYSLARGIGSLSFVVISALTGVLVEKTSIRIIPLISLLLIAYQAISFFRIRNDLTETAFERKGEENASMLRFIRENPRLTIMLFGTAILFFSHNVITNFLINIVRNVGGDAGMSGLLNSFMALMELPVMFLYDRLFGKKDQGRMLKIAFIAFTVKELSFALSKNTASLLASFLFQAPSFAIYSSAIVPYVDSRVKFSDSAKAQSLSYTMTNLGAVLASVIAGTLYDTISVTSTLWVGLAVSAIGTVICLLGMKDR